MMSLYQLFLDRDATMLEINPMIEDDNKKGSSLAIHVTYLSYGVW